MLAPMAHRKNIDLAVDEFADTYISADSTSLRLLLRNLLDNAISYTQDNGSIEVKVSSTNESVNLIIQDNGPGIPAEQHERVCERFYRIGDSEVPGCGIGLSIVIRVIELHHASLKMSQPANGTGLIVTVSFPVD
jgi:signal transduction histidine kinase